MGDVTPMSAVDGAQIIPEGVTIRLCDYMNCYNHLVFVDSLL